MLKMMKYDLRKFSTPLAFLVVTIVLIEFLLVASALSGKQLIVALSAMLMFLWAGLAFTFVFIFGLYSYSNDLSHKSGYLVFMAPISYYKIIGSKILSTLLLGAILFCILAVFGVSDWLLVNYKFGYERTISDLADIFKMFFGLDLTETILNIASLIITAVVEIFSFYSLAYFAISLSSTVLQNKKSKGVLSFILFIILMVATSYITVKIADMDALTITLSQDAPYWQSALLQYLWANIFGVVVAVLAYIGSAELLKRKIAL